MTWAKSELAAPSPKFRTTPAGGLSAPTHDLMRNRPKYTAGIQWNRVFEPGTLRPRSRNLTTRAPRPLSNNRKDGLIVSREAGLADP
ncbi:hypothetical protein AVEN_254931-1 [Araneus ventricosus]|uniref:Uncharacterized protein n=1 Tax=Araneus ventricosus TaxID=182803 RepID=A0A4Y2K4U0_ARAVE|nr:hypothetical protein AVEN_254931-1 [Araneus ventricosus]